MKILVQVAHALILILLKCVIVASQKATSLIQLDQYLTCTTSSTGLQYNYQQLGGFKSIMGQTKFSISGTLLFNNFDDTIDGPLDKSLISMTYNLGYDYTPYQDYKSKVLSFRLQGLVFSVYVLDKSTSFPTTTLTKVLDQSISPSDTLLKGKEIFFFLSIDFISGKVVFCHFIINEQNKCQGSSPVQINPNFNDPLDQNTVLNFGYDKNFEKYCQGVTDLKFYTGFYTDDSLIIDSLIGGERIKKSFWKFDEISTSGGIADQWRSRNSQATVDPQNLSSQQLRLFNKNQIKMLDSQMNEMKSHTISFWLNTITNVSEPLEQTLIMSRAKSNISIFGLKLIKESTSDVLNKLVVILYDSTPTAIETAFLYLLPQGKDLFICLSIFQIRSMKDVQVRLIVYDQTSSTTPFITETLVIPNAVYPRGGLESDPVNNYFLLGNSDSTFSTTEQIFINELAIQSGHSIFQAQTTSQFFISDNCELSIGILNPACMVCKSGYYLNHLDGKCYKGLCPPDYKYQAENPNQRICELCDSTCLSKYCIGLAPTTHCLDCAEGYFLSTVTNTCITQCGDGLVRGNEECDLAAGDTHLGCVGCKVISPYECINYYDKPSTCSKCRDNFYDPHLINEQCEKDLTPVGCSDDCKIQKGYECANNVCYSICGDGIVGFGEQCDDGNTSENDGCNKQCLLETDYVCYYNNPTDTLQTCKKSNSCGDGILGSSTEECDDGNNTTGDGCDSMCKIETSLFTCSSDLDKGKSVCSPICGDGKHVVGKEDCDIGVLNGIGCNLCKVETGYTCSGGDLTQPDICTEKCGDQLVIGNEICDLGLNSQICLNNCKNVDPRWICTINSDKKSECQPKCGDGKKFTEECDDGNLIDGDGCDSQCKVELGYICKNGDQDNPDTCAKKCGNTTNDIIECDDGNNVNGDGCTSNCKIEKGYVCKKQNTQSLIPLPDVCFSICGDGILTKYEDCDDGNSINGDGCSYTCNVEPGYTCNSQITQDSLSISVCKGLCGDGIRLSSEECDDGNVLDLDGCTYNCMIEEEYGCLKTTNTSTSICMSCPSSTCSKCNIYLDSNSQLQNECTKCKDGYYLDQNNQCQTCSDNCVQCSSSTTCLQCVGGYVLDLTMSCVVCSPANGYNLNETTYECSEICGDGKKVGVEECDDGNTQGGDGCNIFCSVEYGYKCSGGSQTEKDACWKTQGTLAVMIQDKLLPNILRIQFEDEVIITQSLQWELKLPFLSDNSYKFDPIVADQEIQIKITFADDNPQIKGEYAYFYFNDLTSVKTKLGLQDLTQNKITALLKYELNPEWNKISDSSTEMIIIEVFIYIATFTFLASFIASVVITSSIPFWSTIEFLQTVNLLQYQNAELPDKLKYFLSLFNFSNLRLIGDMKVKQGDELYTSVEAPEQFQKNGLNNLFLFNFIPILVIWVVVLSLYATSIAYLKLKTRTSSIMTSGIERQSCLHKFMKNYSETFKYNIIVRTLIFIFTPLTLITLLQVSGSNFNFALTGISTILSYGSLFVIVSFPVLAYTAIRQRFNKIDSQMFFKKFGSLLFGLNLKSNVTRVFNVQNTVKKFMMCLFLVTMHNNPISQSALISILSCINLGLILYFSPKADIREQNRITFGEICLFIIHCCYMIFAFDDQTYRLNGTFKMLVGWFVIILIMVGYIIEALFLAKQIISHIKQKSHDKAMRDKSQNDSQLKNINRIYRMQSQSIDAKQNSKQDIL